MERGDALEPQFPGRDEEFGFLELFAQVDCRRFGVDGLVNVVEPLFALLLGHARVHFFENFLELMKNPRVNFQIRSNILWPSEVLENSRVNFQSVVL